MHPHNNHIEIDRHLMLDVEHVSHFQARGWRRQWGTNLSEKLVRLGIVIMMLIWEDIMMDSSPAKACQSDHNVEYESIGLPERFRHDDAFSFDFQPVCCE